MPNIEVVQAGATVGRKLRNPRHSFAVRQVPYAIQPFFIAPVLPGETMKNLLVQALVVSDPLSSGITGWWYEQYYFYVKHRDLDERDLVTEMHLLPETDVSSLLSAASTPYYHGGGINWTKLCLNAVVRDYFRNEGETVDDFTIGGLPQASINVDNWLDSAKLEGSTPVHDEDLPGEVEQVPDGVPAGFENHYAQWQHMRALRLTEATFADYLKTFGVRPARELKPEIHRPELLRYVKDWTYPTQIVDPDGNPARGCIWSVSERADKDRFFAEPGFLLGVSVARPKVYLRNQVGAAVSLMDSAYAWLPALMQDEPFTSLRRVAADAPESPLIDTIEDAYWVDLRDLLVYGDQFLNFDLASTDAGMVALPGTFLQRRYAMEADVTAMLADPLRNLIRSDGVVSLSIASRITDTSGHGGGGNPPVGGGGGGPLG